MSQHVVPAPRQLEKQATATSRQPNVELVNFPSMKYTVGMGSAFNARRNSALEIGDAAPREEDEEAGDEE